MAGRVGEPDAAVAEEVEGAAEARVGGDSRTIEVDDPVIEEVVVVGGAIAAQERPRVGRGRLPFRLREDERRLRVLGDPGAVVEVQMGEDHGLQVEGVDPALTELGREVAAGLDLRPGEAGDELAEVGRGLRCDRSVEGGVDEDRPDRRVGDQVGRDRHQPPARLRRSDAEHAQGREPSAAALEEPLRGEDRAAEQRFDLDRDPRLTAAGKRLVQCLRFCFQLAHPRPEATRRRRRPRRSARRPHKVSQGTQ